MRTFISVLVNAKPMTQGEYLKKRLDTKILAGSNVDLEAEGYEVRYLSNQDSPGADKSEHYIWLLKDEFESLFVDANDPKLKTAILFSLSNDYKQRVCGEVEELITWSDGLLNLINKYDSLEESIVSRLPKELLEQWYADMKSYLNTLNQVSAALSYESKESCENSDRKENNK